MPNPYTFNQTLPKPTLTPEEEAMNKAALEGLKARSAAGPGGALEQEMARQSADDAYQDALFRARRSGDTNWERALTGLIGQRAQDYEGSQTAFQQKLGRDYQTQAYKAGLEGYGSPQEQAGYERGLAEEKLRQPVELERMRIAPELEKQRIASEAPVRVEQERQRGQEAIQRLIGQQAQGVQVAPGGRVSVTKSGFSITSPKLQNINTGLINQVQRAALAANKPGAGNAEKMAHQQAITNLIQGSPVDDDVKVTVSRILNSAVLSGLPFDSIMARATGSIPPDHANDIRELLAMARGRDF